MHKVRHEERIYTIAWKPAGPWTTVPKLRKLPEPYLMSSIASIKPPSIRIWDCHAKEITILHPSEVDTKSRKLVETYVPALWVTHPITNEVALVSSGLDGEVVIWADNKNIVPQTLHTLCTNYVVSAFVQSGDILWTLTAEPLIVGLNLRTGETSIIPTYNGICTMQASPLEHTRVAVGGMDSSIRILKMGAGYPQAADQDAPIVSAELKGKITAVRWK
jgi:WD40 repeat protein